MPEPESSLDAYFDDLSGTYKESFGPESMREKLGECAQELSIPVNHSATWALCSLLCSAKEGMTVCMMTQGTRAFDAANRIYYERILERGASMDMLLGRRDPRQLNYIGYLQDTCERSFRVRYTAEESQGTHRIVTLGSLFALDARKMLLRARGEPSYISTLYYDEEGISDIKSNFEDIWVSSHEISKSEMKDIKPSWWNPLKSRRPLRW